MPNNPIVTIKLTSAQISRGVGPNVRVKIKIKDGPEITRIRAGVTWLYQAPASGGAYSAHIEFTEMDPVFPDKGSTDKSLSVSVASPPPQSGTDVAELTVEAVGGDVGKTAKSTFNLKWWVTPSAADVAEFIATEMRKNAAGSTAARIRERIETVRGVGQNPLKLLVAGFEESRGLHEFATLCADPAGWDYKTRIYGPYGEFTLDAEVGKLYRSDIWANVHYGYIGRAVGIPRDFLLEAAGYNQARSDGKTYRQIVEAVGEWHAFDPPEDQTAIRVGMRLWDELGSGVTGDDVIEGIRRAGPGLNPAKKAAPEGTPPDSFLEKLQ